MIHETEKTFLLYCRHKNLSEIKKVIPLSNISLLINRKANKIIFFFDDVKAYLFKDIQDFCLDITNDPLCDPKYPVVNLGYYSTRFEGRNGKCHVVNGKTLIEFCADDLKIFFNLPLHLPIIDGQNFLSQLSYNDEDLYFFKFSFKESTYDLGVDVFRDGHLKTFCLNLLSIDECYEELSACFLSTNDFLKKFDLI